MAIGDLILQAQGQQSRKLGLSRNPRMASLHGPSVPSKSPSSLDDLNAMPESSGDEATDSAEDTEDTEDGPNAIVSSQQAVQQQARPLQWTQHGEDGSDDYIATWAAPSIYAHKSKALNTEAVASLTRKKKRITSYSRLANAEKMGTSKKLKFNPPATSPVSSAPAALGPRPKFQRPAFHSRGKGQETPCVNSIPASSLPTQDSRPRVSKGDLLLASAATRLNVGNLHDMQSSGTTIQSSQPHIPTPTSDDAAYLSNQEIDHGLSDSILDPFDKVPQSSFSFITNSDSPCCPACHQPLDADWLDSMTAGRKGLLTIRRQGEICREHRRVTAREEWERLGYPKVDWSSLVDRIQTYLPRIEVNLQTRSTRSKHPPYSQYYRNILDGMLLGGKARTLKQALVQGSSDMESTTPGYYGSRGAKVMVEMLVERFGSQLRRLAAKDRLIAAAGVSGYTQMVLVPELAVMLVQDDMGVDEDRARQILAESADMGIMLNEEEEETIEARPEDKKADSNDGSRR